MAVFQSVMAVAHSSPSIVNQLTDVVVFNFNVTELTLGNIFSLSINGRLRVFEEIESDGVE